MIPLTFHHSWSKYEARERLAVMRGNIDWGRIVPLLRSAPRLQSIQSEVLTGRRNIPIRILAEKIQKFFGDFAE